MAFAPAVGEWFAQLKIEATQAPTGRDAALYRSAARIVSEIIGNRTHALDVGYRLRGALASISRVKAGRLRLFYIASAQRGRAIVLAVGYRKEGDHHDAYTDFERRIRRGEFDPQFAELGIDRPRI